MPKGRIDVRGTMQVTTDVVDGWVREHPAVALGASQVAIAFFSLTRRASLPSSRSPG